MIKDEVRRKYFVETIMPVCTLPFIFIGMSLIGKWGDSLGLWDAGITIDVWYSDPWLLLSILTGVMGSAMLITFILGGRKK